jgi:hypothetical protein
MTNSIGSAKHISRPVQDQQGTAYTVQLMVTEQNETNTLSILTCAGEVAQQFELSHLKKSRDGTRLSCHISGATATLMLKRDKNPPELHVQPASFSRFLRRYMLLTPQSKSGLWGGLPPSVLVSWIHPESDVQSIVTRTVFPSTHRPRLAMTLSGHTLHAMPAGLNPQTASCKSCTLTAFRAPL